MAKLIFEKSHPGRSHPYLHTDISLKEASCFLPPSYIRKDLQLPSLGEQEVVRHYTLLSQKNFSVDTHFYPLGSCTMKYNPKVNEEIANWEEFLDLHPYEDEDLIQGALEIIYNLEKILCEITGMSRFSFQPSAGAHGELAGMLIIRAYHAYCKKNKYKVIIPDSSHGTNPATSTMCGYTTVVVESRKDGLIDIDKLFNLMDDEVAGVMLTNPNTLGLFEEEILTISEITHKKGALLYYDGANFNPLLGITKPSLMGFDLIHLNLHKTFSTPHGSGGPGAGALGVAEFLKDFLPIPVVEKEKDRFLLNYNLSHTIGRVRSFYGNFPVLLRAYAYLLNLGREGLLRVAHHSVINANYLREKLKSYFTLASPRRCMHEVVFSCICMKSQGVSALDIAKRLIDYGIHPPTMYFPLIVKEALMVEPTESESKETLDYFIFAMEEIYKEIANNPQILKNAPHTTKIKRLNEAEAARQPDLRWPGSKKNKEKACRVSPLIHPSKGS